MIYLINAIDEGGSEHPLGIIEGPEGLDFKQELDNYVASLNLVPFTKTLDVMRWNPNEGLHPETIQREYVTYKNKEYELKYFSIQYDVMKDTITWLSGKGYVKLIYKELNI